MARVWITDLWNKEDPSDPRKKIPTSKHGHGSRWKVEWYEEQPDGTQKRRGLSFAKRADAEAWQTKTSNDLRAGIYQSAEDAARTVGDAVEAWFLSKQGPKPSSRGTYRRRIDNYVLPRWERVRLSTITRLEIDTWTSELALGTATHAIGMRWTASALAPATVKAVLVPFKAGLRYAVMEGWLARNPALGAETPRAKSEPVVFLNYAELERLIEFTKVAASAQDGLLVAIMGNTGIRPGEAYALSVADVDLKARRIDISKTLTTDGKSATVLGDSPKTRAGIRAVPIPPHLIEDLRNQVGKRPTSQPLFPSGTGTYLSPPNWRNRVFNPAVKASGLSTKLTPKGLRHTAASLAIASGADVLMVQRMLGHSNAKETLNTYAKLFPDRLDEVTASMSTAREKALKKAKRTKKE